jgi:hypothetical protein
VLGLVGLELLLQVVLAAGALRNQLPATRVAAAAQRLHSF